MKNATKKPAPAVPPKKAAPAPAPAPQKAPAKKTPAKKAATPAAPPPEGLLGMIVGLTKPGTLLDITYDEKKTPAKARPELAFGVFPGRVESYNEKAFLLKVAFDESDERTVINLKTHLESMGGYISAIHAQGETPSSAAEGSDDDGTTYL